MAVAPGFKSLLCSRLLQGRRMQLRVCTHSTVMNYYLLLA
jgi:hypothetical protein